MNMNKSLQPSSLVKEFTEKLSEAGVRYCHWKSNNKIGLSESGENDLDILVLREDIRKLKEILFSLGFKNARFRRGARARPGVEDYYGYDSVANRVIHVHAHYQLVVGSDYTKSFRLPIERQVIEGATYQHSRLLPTPRAEIELLIFGIRMMLKWTLVGALRKRGRVLASASKDEFDFLHGQCDMQEVLAGLRDHFPTIQDGLISSLFQMLEANNATIVAQYRLYTAFRTALHKYSMNSRFMDAATVNYRRLVSSVAKRASIPRENRRLPTGGIQLAVVGGDGAGKSTAVSEIHSWLSKDFEVRRLHLGKPRRSFTTLCFDVFLRLSGIRKSFPKDTAVDSFPGYFWMLRMVLYARDRCLCARKGALAASKGVFVVYDRFPMRQLSEMDTLCCGLAVRFDDSWLAKTLERIEAGYFSKIRDPDYMVFLKVDPSVAVARKDNEDPDYVRTRNEEISSLEWMHERCEVVDANRCKDEVLIDLKNHIWKVL